LNLRPLPPEGCAGSLRRIATLVMSFGSFRVPPYQRLLLEGDRPLRLGSRAFDILTALVERAGEVVNEDELTARAWPQTFVEGANLKTQVSTLRRALGDGHAGHCYVVTIPGRGNVFVASVRHEGTVSHLAALAKGALNRRSETVDVKRRVCRF
jgi:DNA-binding winged helix-turn-helix (wHTH) protein